MKTAKDILEMLRMDWRTATKDMEAIQRVRDLHRPHIDDWAYLNGLAVKPTVQCKHCSEDGNCDWPCPTICALDGDQ